MKKQLIKLGEIKGKRVEVLRGLLMMGKHDNVGMLFQHVLAKTSTGLVRNTGTSGCKGYEFTGRIVENEK